MSNTKEREALWRYLRDVAHEGTVNERTVAVAALKLLASLPPEQAVRVQPLSEEQAIALWHENKDAHQRVSAFEWFAAGIIAAERAHGIGLQLNEGGK